MLVYYVENGSGRGFVFVGFVKVVLYLVDGNFLYLIVWMWVFFVIVWENRVLNVFDYWGEKVDVVYLWIDVCDGVDLWSCKIGCGIWWRVVCGDRWNFIGV